MKTTTVRLLSLAATPLILAAAAEGGFVGITTHVKPNSFGIKTVNVYAVFDRPGQDVMAAVAGTTQYPLLIEVIGGTFYQNPFGTDEAPLGLLVQKVPAVAYDSFVTIGVKCVESSPGFPPECQPADLTALLNWPGFGPSSLSGSNFAWAAINPQTNPFDPVNSYAGNGEILIGQFSTQNGVAIHGTMLLSYTSNGLPNVQSVARFLSTVGGDTLIASADTYVTEHVGLGGSNSTHGSDPGLWTIGTGGFGARPLLRFDLSAYAGSVANGPGYLLMSVNFFHGAAPPGATNSIDLRLVTSPWNADTVTWNTQPAVATTLDTEVVSNGEVNTWQAWTIPQQTIQSWIDSPSSNFGVMLLSTTTEGQRDVIFDSLEGPPGREPRLIVSVISCPWDCDGSGDGIVAVTDLLALLAQYDPQAPAGCAGGSCDYNGDNCVDVVDLLKLLAHYDPAGLGCP